ncbi:trypsin-like serine peptidase [Rhodovulum marinum]|uniref:Protease YdgD n=1 Tax=Rhodovulum marinum TaxID=320662 RepID=A0A4R2PU30_9RHOB|nr:trypsin-like peptidase domain-containing protein [Rhodovulum marinum]TCP38674.1 protease YdgD [Rhodovulum marinum]
MRWPGLAFLALLLLAPLPAASDTGLRRLGQRADLLGWEAVGRLDQAGGGFCTGVLVAPDLVLTAAHCLFDRAGQRVDPARLTFRAGLSDGTAIAAVAGRRAVIHEGYRPDDPDAMARLRADAALVQLARAIPAAVAAPFAAGRAVGKDGTVSVVSYARGRENALSWQRGCTVIERAQGLYAFSCDVWFGSSGAPVFENSSGRARIVSIVSAGNREGGETVAFGTDAAEALDSLRAALRAGRGVFPAEGVTARRLPAGGGGRDIGARFVRP